MNKSGSLGTMAETAVARYLQTVGWPDAERRRPNGQYDRGDITGVPRVVIEVKGGKAAEKASDGQVEAWMEETRVETVNADASLGFLVMKRKGIGHANAGQWWAVFRGRDYAFLVHGEEAEHDLHVVCERPVRIRLAEAAQLLALNGYGGKP